MRLASSQWLERSASGEKGDKVQFTKQFNEISVNQRNQWFPYRAPTPHSLPLCHPDGRRDLHSRLTLSLSKRLASSQRLEASASGEKGDKVQFTKHFNAISVNQRNQWFPYRAAFIHSPPTFTSRRQEGSALVRYSPTIILRDGKAMLA